MDVVVAVEVIQPGVGRADGSGLEQRYAIRDRCVDAVEELPPAI
jgi:hypothetical protein